MWLPKCWFKKSQLYSVAEMWFFLYIIIVITIISIIEMIARAKLQNNDKINNCKSIPSNISHHLAFLCTFEMVTTFYFSLFLLKLYIVHLHLSILQTNIFLPFIYILYRKYHYNFLAYSHKTWYNLPINSVKLLFTSMWRNPKSV